MTSRQTKKMRVCIHNEQKAPNKKQVEINPYNQHGLT